MSGDGGKTIPRVKDPPARELRAAAFRLAPCALNLPVGGGGSHTGQASRR
jgi:hypothetical protein